jgi:hypothetical protein
MPSAKKAAKSRKQNQASDEAVDVVAAIICKSSEQGCLISEEAIMSCAAEQEFLTASPSGRQRELRKILAAALKKDDNLQAAKAPDGSRIYYSAQFITQAYAAILLRKLGDPLRLIAEVVRENSKVYPRPVPADMFTMPPFDLTERAIAGYLRKMKADKAYQDIVQIKTSTARKFLFSSNHLEKAHASLLAEWFDVGQGNNP